MTDEKPKISVVIATKNRLDDIIKCIESILVQTVLPDEMVIVDASDTQELNSKIGEFKSEKTKFVYVHTKPGLTHQRNVGIGASCGDIVFFLDDDVILNKDFIKEIVNVFENNKEAVQQSKIGRKRKTNRASNPKRSKIFGAKSNCGTASKERKIGGVCGDIINIKSQNRSVMHSLKGAISTILATIFFLNKIGNGEFRLSGFPTYPYGVNKMINVECLPGGLTAYRREVLNESKFDENLHGYCYMEDDDFSYRVSRKYKNVYVPYAKVIHNSAPIASDKKYARKKQLIENHYYLFKKNFPQTFTHKFAFYMSIIGLFICEIMSMLIKRNANGLKGLINGMININKK